MYVYIVPLQEDNAETVSLVSYASDPELNNPFQRDDINRKSIQKSKCEINGKPNRQADRKIERERDGQADRKIERERDGQADRQRERERERKVFG